MPSKTTVPAAVLLDSRPARGKHRRRDLGDRAAALLLRSRRVLTVAVVAGGLAAMPGTASAEPVIEAPPVDYGVLDDPCSYAVCDGAGWHLPDWVLWGDLVAAVLS